MSKGKLIVLEGLDGSGKATQAKLLEAHLKEQGFSVREITFPNYESDSSALVKMYLAGQFGQHPDDVNAYAASSFYAVDRYASYKKDWGSFYENGGIIIAATPPPTRCTSAPSFRWSSGRVFSAGCLILNSICWACLRRMR
jgi:dTMP kinase